MKPDSISAIQNRRQLLALAGGAAVIVVSQTTTGRANAQGRTAPGKPAPSPLPAPATLDTANPSVMTAAPLKRRLRTDLPLERAPELDLWAFNGVVPGPVIRLTQGQEINLRVENRVDRPLSLHWHGVRNVAAMDGVGGFSQPAIAPGESHTYRFTPPDSGVFLYRPLVVGGSGELAERGLSGLLIVDEPVPPSVDRDIAILVDDWLLHDDGKMAPFATSAPDTAAAGRLGSWMTANGRSLPERATVRPGARVRIRIANGANARILRIRFDGVKAQVLAVDGQPTDTFEPLRGTLPFPPGARYDVMVDMPTVEGAVANVTALIGPGVSLLRIATEGKTQRDVALPEIAPLPANKALPPGIKLQQAVRAEITIQGGAQLIEGSRLDVSGLDPAHPWRINGGIGDPAGKPLFVVRRGQPVVLAINNTTAFSQPIHLHGHTARLLHPLDDGWESYFIDTVQIPEGRKLHISFLADNPGRWLISSTILERFDAGLWTWFEVT